MSLFGGDTASPPRTTHTTEIEITPDPSVDGATGSTTSTSTGDSDAYGEYDEHEELHDRPNRFQRHGSTWRQYTREERKTAEAIDLARAEDLSAHLYNAYVLKHASAQPDAPWTPPHSWTSWPLEHGTVLDPRAIFTSKHRAQQPLPLFEPRKALRDQICASALSIARQQWEARDEASHQDDDTTVASPLFKEDTAQEQEESDEPAQPASTERPTRPVLSADDERSYALLGPSVQHIMTQLDNVLLALHHNRQGHRVFYRGGASRASSPSRSRSASRTPAESRRRSRSESRLKRQRSSDLDDYAVSPLPDNHGTPSKRQRRSRKASTPPATSSKHHFAQSQAVTTDHGQLLPRDWSEVIGLAALAGWDPDVVDRAARRCAGLFNQGMDFRVLQEDPNDSDNEPITILPSSHPEFPEPDDVPSGTVRSSSKTNPRGWVPPNPMTCPHARCKWHTKVFPARSRLAVHLKNAHHYDPRYESPPRSSSQRRRSEGDASEAVLKDSDLVGGVHNDGFLEEIPATIGGRGLGKKTAGKASRGTDRDRTDDVEESSQTDEGD